MHRKFACYTRVGMQRCTRYREQIKSTALAGRLFLVHSLSVRSVDEMIAQFLPEVREFITRHTAYNKHDTGGEGRFILRKSQEDVPRNGRGASRRGRGDARGAVPGRHGGFHMVVCAGWPSMKGKFGAGKVCAHQPRRGTASGRPSRQSISPPAQLSLPRQLIRARQLSLPRQLIRARQLSLPRYRLVPSRSWREPSPALPAKLSAILSTH